MERCADLATLALDAGWSDLGSWEALAEVLPILAANERTPSVMFFGNDASGPEPMISALGRERVLLGFPGAAAIPHDGTIRYVITSRREQPTTIGELDGGRSERIAAIASAIFQRRLTTRPSERRTRRRARCG